MTQADIEECLLCVDKTDDRARKGSIVRRGGVGWILDEIRKSWIAGITSGQHSPVLNQHGRLYAARSLQVTCWLKHARCINVYNWQLFGDATMSTFNIHRTYSCWFWRRLACNRAALFEESQRIIPTLHLVIFLMKNMSFDPTTRITRDLHLTVQFFFFIFLLFNLSARGAFCT